jgi:hypothetical protein
MYGWKWHAACPRCSQRTSQADYQCRNCQRGFVLLSQHGKGRARVIFFGCRVCGAPEPGVVCKKCGAQLHEPVVKADVLPRWAIVLIAIVMLLVVFAMILPSK